ncbi:D-alanyl-D-alanine carboxypeptidase [Bacillus sp. A301a_S52]|nr:D-alanyl-D-alanine carboxypeptidase [Bacillus sp. A301a_S52]
MKKLVTGCLSVLFFLTHIGFTSAEETTLEFAEEATSAILMERDTGTVLFDKNSHERLPPASMTKIMTMLLIMEAIDEGRLNWDDKVRTSERAASMGGSQIFLEPGEEMTVKEMMKGIAIVSGNDASVAMAEHLAGTEKEFVRLMNDRAKELGLTNTLFANSNGLPADNHYSSAYDLAIMGKALLQHEKITEFTSIYEDYLREDTSDPFWLVNTNKLIKFYPGVDGLKTGYTEEAKYCLTASANKDGMRMISVVMGAPATKDRNRYITEMFDYAYSQFELHNRYQPEDILAEAKIDKGARRHVNLVPATPVSLLIKKGQSLDGLTEKVTVSDHVRAPVKKGDQLGIITLHQDGKEVLSQPLVAQDDIKEASIWQLMKRAKDALSGRAS